MAPRPVTAGCRALVAALVLAAIVTQFADGVGEPKFSVINFFSFFTILSNLIGVAVFTACAVAPARAEAGDFDVVRGAATTYLAITGLVYATLLREVTETLGTVTPWVNTVVHVLMPLAIVADWLVNPPARRLAWVQTRWWLVYPLAYLAYSLVRGPIVDWYPYPFLDPDHTGSWWGVAAYAVAIAALFVGVILLVAWVGNRLGDKKSPAVGA